MVSSRYQIAGLSIMLILLVSYISRKNLKLYSEDVFLRTMLCVFTNLILDIVSLWFIINVYTVPLLISELVCKLYLVSLLWVASSALLYTLIDILDEHQHRRLIRRVDTIQLFEGLIILLLPISIFNADAEFYTYGPSVISTYIMAVSDLLIAIACVIKYHKDITPRRLFGVVLWIMIWIGATIIQFLNNQILIVGFATSLGMVILFILLENPESCMDWQMSCFNNYAQMRYLRQSIVEKDDFSAICIVLNADETKSVAPEQIAEQFKEIVKDLSKVKKTHIFKNSNNEILLITEDRKKYTEIREHLESQYQIRSHLYQNTYVLLMEQGILAKNENELVSILHFAENTVGYRLLEETSEIGESLVYSMREEEEIRQEIESAMKEDRILVYYQPIYHVGEKKFHSAEALVRLQKRDGTFISPGKFIPIAENSGQIVQLGEIIFEKVCRFIQNSKAISLGLKYVEINLSVVQCEKEDLASSLISIMKNYNIRPSSINLEITETASVTTKKNLIENMKKLMAYGIQFSLDDFGQGESNLNYVVDMNVAIVKLDDNMTHSYFTEPKARYVIEAVERMAHNLNLELVAEGVETVEEFEAMVSLNIDQIQGFYFSRPIPENEYLEFMQRNN